MAISDKRDQIILGDSGNKRQSCVTVPGLNVDEFPGILNLQYVTSNTATDAYIFLDSAGTTLRVNTSASFGDSDGTALTGSGASTALDNLASVQINQTLAFDAANTYDVGDDPDAIRTLYWTTSLKKIGTTHDVILAATEPAAASYTYTFPDAAAAADVMLDTGAATAITYTKSTANITLGAAASFDMGAAAALDLGASANVDFAASGVYNFVGNVDVASGKTVNIDEAVTIAGGTFTTSAACTLDQDLAAAQSPTWVGLTLTGAIATPTNITMSGYLLLGDDQQARFGAEGATDSYIQYDATGDDLEFYDRTAGGPYSLSQLVAGTPLNPIVTGDLTISDGQFDWVNTATADTNTWDFGATTVDTFDIVCDNTTAAFLDIEADSFTAHGTAAEGLIDINVDSITSGNVIVIDTNQAGTFTGSYLKFYTDGSTDAFTVKGYGATVIAGVGGGTAALTLTKGDVVMSDGVINADVDSAHGHNFATSQAGSATYPLLTLTSSDASHDEPLLKATAASTGDINVVEIDNFGTGYGLSIDLGGKTDAEGIEMIFDAGSTDNGIFLDADTGSQTYVGKSGAGMLHIHQSGTFAATDSTCIFVNVDGTTQSGGEGYAMLIDDDSTSGGAADVAVYINTLDGVPLKLEGQAVDQNTLVVEAGAAQAVAAVNIDLASNDWDGDDDVGALSIVGNTALADVGATQLYVANSGGAVPISDAQGHLARFEDLSNAGGGTAEYAVEIFSNNNEAFHVAKGATLLAGTLEVTGTQTFTGAATFTTGGLNAAVARTANATPGAGTSTIGANEGFIDVTSGGATAVIQLPTPVLGHVIFMTANGSTDFEVQPGANTEFINGTECTGTPPKEILVTAEDLTVIACVKAGATARWISFSVTDAGVVTNGVTPD